MHYLSDEDEEESQEEEQVEEKESQVDKGEKEEVPEPAAAEQEDQAPAAAVKEKASEDTPQISPSKNASAVKQVSQQSSMVAKVAKQEKEKAVEKSPKVEIEDPQIVQESKKKDSAISDDKKPENMVESPMSSKPKRKHKPTFVYEVFQSQQL